MAGDQHLRRALARKDPHHIPFDLGSAGVTDITQVACRRLRRA